VSLTPGAASGIGASAVACFAAAGARTIYVADLKAPSNDLASKGYNTKVVGAACDITQEDQVEALVRQVIKEEGRLDWFVSIYITFLTSVYRNRSNKLSSPTPVRLLQC
jgi:NAD(P)-dependent dehydrogenase (short-subunit alcohol dehydrogenase family)